MNDSLVPSISVANLVAQRNAAIERIRGVHGLLGEVEQILQRAEIVDKHGYMSTDSLLATLRRGGNGGVTFLRQEDVEHAIKKIDAAAWDRLMRESGMMTFMDTQARRAWSEKIYSAQTPELTVENVQATFEQLRDARGEIFDRGVVNCFRQLSWHHKTNQPQKFGKRIIMTLRYSSGGIRNESSLDDLNRVFCLLDGKPEPDHRSGLGARLSGYEREHRLWEKAFAFDDHYMAIKVFKNGRAHITFLRPDLVDKMNKILAKHHPNALPAPKGGR